ncbi:hypothetical protein J8273_8210 [Carpediemonas membranifera]|uniref:Uncharacterized protein n=1 Tax=Carpediemonas membranifera TaxID=201153 RepID=A0A8J6ARA1_9EUKA|nr:hypothetical protein J8273_8210 [Carpediemonas membranifera]|eukprot:KAG9390170.1 hypothetical protein J8273_8210 [Carpediemonas membranifera]
MADTKNGPSQMSGDQAKSSASSELITEVKRNVKKLLRELPEAIRPSMDSLQRDIPVRAVADIKREAFSGKTPVFGVDATIDNLNNAGLATLLTSTMSPLAVDPDAIKDIDPLYSQLTAVENFILPEIPLADGREVVSCNHCGQPVYRSTVGLHLDVCPALADGERGELLRNIQKGWPDATSIGSVVLPKIEGGFLTDEVTEVG